MAGQPRAAVTFATVQCLAMAVAEGIGIGL